METQGAPPDPALDALAETRRPLQRMARLATVGLVVWLGLLAWFAHKLVDLGGDLPVGKLFMWSIIGLPILLHLWPILHLRAASRELAVFVSEPSDKAATAALRAQRGYWRAAAISHAIIVVWFVVVLIMFIAGQGNDLANRALSNAGKEAASHGAR